LPAAAASASKSRPSATQLLVAPATAEIVAARDAAILKAVTLRPWKTEALLTVLPEEPGQTPEQRKAALDSALIRLRVKKRIQVTPDGWKTV
jgi:hypothetical protein